MCRKGNWYLTNLTSLCVCLVRFVQLIIHNRVKSLDLSIMPKVHKPLKTLVDRNFVNILNDKYEGSSGSYTCNTICFIQSSTESCGEYTNYILYNWYGYSQIGLTKVLVTILFVSRFV